MAKMILDNKPLRDTISKVTAMKTAIENGDEEFPQPSNTGPQTPVELNGSVFCKFKPSMMCYYSDENGSVQIMRGRKLTKFLRKMRKQKSSLLRKYLSTEPGVSKIDLRYNRL